MPTTPGTGHLLEFGPFAFDRRSLELTRDGHPVPLQQQPAQVLALFVERAGTLVTLEELRLAVWDADSDVNFDRGLHYCINQIRAALGDSAEAPRYLETLRGRGYRFTDDVRAVVPEPVGGLVRPLAVLIFLVVAGLTITIGWWTLAPGASGPAEPALGVAAFSAEDDTRDWTDVLRAEVLARLDHDAHLDVVDLVPNADTFVPWRLEGRVDRSGAGVRVTVVVRDERTSAVAWSDVFETSPGDPSATPLPAIIADAVRMAVEGPLARPAGAHLPQELGTGPGRSEPAPPTETIGT